MVLSDPNITPLSLGRGAGGEGSGLTSFVACATSLLLHFGFVKDEVQRQGVPSPLTPGPAHQNVSVT